jgi:hypothetical protein
MLREQIILDALKELRLYTAPVEKCATYKTGAVYTQPD